jgi:hypothetical protein
MTSHPQHRGSLHNQLLGALALDIRERIAPHLEHVPLKIGEVVCEAGMQLRHAYFPEGCGSRPSTWCKFGGGRGSSSGGLCGDV